MKGKVDIDTELCGVSEEIEADDIDGLHRKALEFVRETFNVSPTFESDGCWDEHDTQIHYFQNNTRAIISLQLLDDNDEDPYPEEKWLDGPTNGPQGYWSEGEY